MCFRHNLTTAGLFAADCAGDFINHRKPSNSNCTANYEYKGPSPFGACKSRDDPTCVSKGPDLVAGAVHILRERVDLLDFTGPYVTVRQVTVKVKKSALPNIMATFQCFDESLWFLGLFFEVGTLFEGLFIIFALAVHDILLLSSASFACVYLPTKTQRC